MDTRGTQPFSNFSSGFYEEYERDDAHRKSLDAVTKRPTPDLKEAPSFGLPSAPSAWGSAGGGGSGGGDVQERESYPRYPAHPLSPISDSPLPQRVANLEQNREVHMTRSEAWHRFLAYESCIQICVMSRDERESRHFLSSGMQELRSGLGIGGLLLKPPSLGFRPMASGCDETSNFQRANEGNNPTQSRQEVLWNDTKGNQAAQSDHPRHTPINQAAQSDHSSHTPIINKNLPHLKEGNHGRRALDFSGCNEEAGPTPNDNARETSSSLGTNGPYLAVRLRDNPQVKIKGGNVIRISYNGRSSSFSIQGSSSSSAPLVIGVGAIQKSSSVEEAGSIDAGALMIEVSSLVGVVGRGHANLGSLIKLAEGELPEDPAVNSGSKVRDVNLGKWIFGRAKEKTKGTDLHQGSPPLSSNQQKQSVSFVAEIRSGNSKLGSVELDVALFDNKEAARSFSLSSARATHSPSPAPLLSSPAPPLSSRNDSAQTPRETMDVSVAHQPPNQLLKLTLDAVMETLFDSAWQMSGCNRANLQLSGNWCWLFNRFVEQNNVSLAWKELIHLQTILQPEHSSTSKEFYDVINKPLSELLKMEKGGRLASHEAELFSRLKTQAQSILQVTLENYHLYLLCESEELGLLVTASMEQADVRVSQRQVFPHSLHDVRFDPIRGALELYKQLQGWIERSQSDQLLWLKKRLEVASRSRWEELIKSKSAALGIDLHAMIGTLSREARGRRDAPVVAKETMVVAAKPPLVPQSPLAAGMASKRQNSASKTPAPPSPSPLKHAVPSAFTSDQIYSALTSLSYGVSSDVYHDSLLQDRLEANSSYRGISFSHHLATQHKERMLEVLRIAFACQPPSSYSTQSLALFVGLADLHLYVQDKMGLKGGMEPLLLLFQPHINTWLKGSEDQLVDLVRDEGKRQAHQSPNRFAPPSNYTYPILPLASSVNDIVPSDLFAVLKVHESLLPSVLKAIETSWCEVQKYESVLASWPAFSIDLEATMSKVMGLVLDTIQSRPSFDFSSPLSAAHLTLFQDAPITISSQDAEGLNSLKLLMVFTSVVETTLVSWSSRGGTDQANNIASIVGSQLSQVNQRIQQGYTDQVSSTVKCLGVLLDQASSRSLSNIISSQSISPTPAMFNSPLCQSVSSRVTKSIVQSALSPLIDVLHHSLASIKVKLEPKVYIAIVRALWDGLGSQIMCLINAQRGGSRAAEEMMQTREKAGCAMAVLSDYFIHHLSDLLFEGDREKLLLAPRRVMEVENMINQRGMDRVGNAVNFSPF